MDINLLLSPQDTPNATSAPSARYGKKLRKPRNTKGSPHNTSQTAPPAPTSSYNGASRPQRPAPTPLPPKGSTGQRASVTPTTSYDNLQGYRQSSSAGMDTLAELAAMQHHQQTARANSGGLRSAEIFDSPKSATNSLSNIHNMTRSEATSILRAHSFDVNMTDSPQRTPPARTYATGALSEADITAVTEAGNHVIRDPFAYDTHVELINLLHRGLLNHIRNQSTSKGTGDPRSYELLQDLRNARDSMSSHFAVGEDVWADWIQDQILLAVSFEDKIAIRELCERAVKEEPTSSKLWIIYGQWMLSEHNRLTSRDDAASASRIGQSNQPTSEEEAQMSAEIFGWPQVLSVWRQGAHETKWRINDSDRLWDQYTDLLLQELPATPQTETIQSLEQLFLDRLQVPHGRWDQTSQKFSTFLSKYDNQNWESIMVETNRRGADARQKYDMRDFKEVNVLRAQQTEDREAELHAFIDYIDYEQGLSHKKNAYSFELANTLFQRATLRFPSNTDLWESYAVFLHDEIGQSHGHTDPILSFLERAVRHCPWSGTLWSQYIITGEVNKLSFSEMENIKHRATSSGISDIGDLNEVLKITTAWCSYLRRRAFSPQATDEEMDMAEVGILSAIEDLRTVGETKYGKEYQGDPDYRLEKIYIKYLTQAHNITKAREQYRQLATTKGHDYDFWLRYYVFEMITWSKMTYSQAQNGTSTHSRPVDATRVLQQALRRNDLNWPEKILSTYLVHCEDHEDAEQLQRATVEYWRHTKALKKKREQEAFEQYQQQQLQQQQQQQLQPAAPAVQSFENYQINSSSEDNLGKRKREEAPESPSKRNREEEVVSQSVEAQVPDQSLQASSLLKRDRENTSVTVKNLPSDTSQARLRQFFKDCGNIISLKTWPGVGHQSLCASIEFETKEDTLTALTKNMKSFDGQSIEVDVGSCRTIYVCNFPATADEVWIRQRFQKFGSIVDIRLPSLKYNTHRRFAYVEFDEPAAAVAATSLHGETVEEGLDLVAQISNPERKQPRHGAIYEGRELFVSNLPWNVSTQDVKQLFRQYGSVESARIPKKINGDSKGIGFVVFRHQEDAKRALTVDATTWNGRVLSVSESTNDPAKKQAILAASKNHRSTSSPTPMAHGEGNESGASVPSAAEKKSEIQSRTIALLNVPDTVNEARIQALAEQHGELMKITLRPKHQGAIIEYRHQSSVGRASLALDGLEILPARVIRVGTVDEMLKSKSEYRSDKVADGQGKKTAILPPPTQVRRPGVGGPRRGGKGGLGLKRGGTALAGDSTRKEESETLAVTENASGEDGAKGTSGKGKTNADFKALMGGT